MSQSGHLEARKTSGFFFMVIFLVSSPAIYLNTMKFFLIYNNFFYRDFQNKTWKIRKINICKRRILYISYILAYSNL